jgi:hypothetical protein
MTPSGSKTTDGAAPHRWRSLGSVYIAPPPAPSHRSFGLTVGGVLAVAAALSVWRHHPTRGEALGVIAAILIVAALVRPRALSGVAAVWARVGHALGWFNSRVLLTVMFVIVLWPIGLVMRMFGSDPLERRARGSMWSPYPERLRDPKHFERLF